MKGPELLKHYEDNWVTDMGAWFPGERVVLRGKDVFTELNNHTWMEYLLFAVTGKQSKSLAMLIDQLWLLTTSYPDPRLWNNRVAALAGTTRSTCALAVAAGTAVSEAKTYGQRANRGALDFLHRAFKKIKQGQSIENIVTTELKTHRSIFGFGRPVVKTDERLSPVQKYLDLKNITHGQFYKILLEINTYLTNSKYKLNLNIGGVNAALMGDNGLTSDEYLQMSTLAFCAGMMPCYIDAKSQPAGAFFPLSTTKINYTGASLPRTWENAQ